MPFNKQSLLVISSFARDRVIYKESGKIIIKCGGPGFWISKTLIDLGVEFNILTGKDEAKIEIIVDEFGESGLIKSVSNILLEKKNEANFIIISTIANEFKLEMINDLIGDIILDIQGYVRYFKIHNKIFSISNDIVRRIKILKATEEEFTCLGEGFVNKYPNIIFLITKGENSVEIIDNGKKYFFTPTKIKLIDTIGAGDVFLTSFTVEFMKNGNVVDSGEFAIQYTSQFLKEHKQQI